MIQFYLFNSILTKESIYFFLLISFRQKRSILLIFVILMLGQFSITFFQLYDTFQFLRQIKISNTIVQVGKCVDLDHSPHDYFSTSIDFIITYMNLQAQKKATKRQFNQNQTLKSMHSNPESDQSDSMAGQFKYIRIQQRYHDLQRRQFENLSEANMSEILKRKLFGFSNSAYLVNKSSSKLIIQNHPIKGRNIMPEGRFYQRQHQRQLSAQIYHVIDQTPNSSEFGSFMNLSGVNQNKKQASNQAVQSDINLNVEGVGSNGSNEREQIMQGSQNRLFREQDM